MTGNTGNLTLEESIKRLTIGETKHLERASGKTMGDLSGPEMTAGVIYLFPGPGARVPHARVLRRLDPRGG
jgi:hypothetical protein